MHDQYHHEGEEDSYIRYAVWEWEEKEKKGRREKEREREREREKERERRWDDRRPPSAPLWINYPESSRGAAPWRIASTPSHVFVNSHSGLRVGCRSTALKYLSIIRSVRAEPSRIADSRLRSFLVFRTKSTRVRGWAAWQAKCMFSNETISSRVRSYQRDSRREN